LQDGLDAPPKNLSDLFDEGRTHLELDFVA
jgi:hypothetical protein